jgi:photosystem II stability/assembly factor-like uncharacterized protein
MFRKFSFLIFILGIMLAGCNWPEKVPKALPSDTAIPAPNTDTPLPPTPEPEGSTFTVTPENTNTPDVTDTPEPETGPTEAEPTEPTLDMTAALSGDLIPILPAGTDITIREIYMVDELTGWGIGVGNSSIQHIFHTADGGKTWQDVTPPQPMISGDGGFSNAEIGVWDANTSWVAFGGAQYIWNTQNGGLTWQAAPLSFMTTYDGMFAVLDKNHVWFFQFLEGGMQKVFTALNSSKDGGKSWDLLLDPYNDMTIQGFDKTGAVFINPDFGWLTRDFRGVDPYVRINFTQDGGVVWDGQELPPPPGLPDLFQYNLGALYDPYLISPEEGSFRLFTRRFENEEMIDQDFLYKTYDGGATWEILDMPSGNLYHISDQILYTVSREIYRSTDGGINWQLVKNVNWDGQFSFVDQNTAWAVAHDPTDDEYALVKTTNGCESFIEIKPKLVASSTQR